MTRMTLEVVVSGRMIPAWQERVLQHLSKLDLARIQVTVRERPSIRAGATHDWLRRRMVGLRLVPLPAGLEHRADECSEADLQLDLCHCDRVPTASATDDMRPRLHFVSPDGCICSACLPFAEAIQKRRPVTRLMLVRSHGSRDSAIVLKEGCWRAQPERYGALIEQVLRDVADWPATAIRNLLTQELPLDGPSIPVKAAVSRVTTLGLVLGMAFGLAYRVWKDLFRHEQWTLGIVAEPIERFLEPGFRPHFQWLVPNGRRTYLADPFGWADGTQALVLAESFDYARNRGEIVSLRYGGSTGWSAVERSLRTPHHLSYPYIVEHDGRRYVMPESFEARAVYCYPLSPQGEASTEGTVVIDGLALVDASVFEWQGRWWLLATDKEQGADSHLHAWFGAAPTGPWQPHANNPVKIDVGNARPAGAPFVVAGQLYRPAQDCTRTYGARVVINRVLELTPVAFREIAVNSCEPDPQGKWRDGLHTLSAIGASYTVVDAKRHVFSPWATASNVRGTLAKLIRRRRRAAQPYNSPAKDSGW